MRLLLAADVELAADWKEAMLSPKTDPGVYPGAESSEVMLFLHEKKSVSAGSYQDWGCPFAFIFVIAASANFAKYGPPK